MRSKLIGGAALVLSCGLVGAVAAQPEPNPMPEPTPMPQPTDQDQGQDQGQAPEVAPMDQGAQPTSECPEFVKGAKLKVSNIDRGVELTITTTTKGNVADLRKMLHGAGDTIAKGSERSLRPGETAADKDRIPPVDVVVKDIPNGARVSVKAKQTTDVSQVRGLATNLDTFWKSSTCVNSAPSADQGKDQSEQSGQSGQAGQPIAPEPEPQPQPQPQPGPEPLPAP